MTPIPTPHVCDSGNFDRSICPDPCGMMHSYCATCGKRQDWCAHDDSITREPRPSRWERIEERFFCLVMAYLTGMVAYAAFTVWENPWLGMFVALGAVGWLLQPYNHGGSR